jgi:hypothetical protein
MTTNKKLTLLLILFGVFSIRPINAANYYLLTDVGSSAESIGLASVEGFNRSSNSIFENPAGLKFTSNKSISFFTTSFMNEIYYSNFSISGKTPWGNIGIGFMESKVQNIPFTGEDAQKQFFTKSFFDYQNTISKLSYQTTMSKDIYIGASLVMYRSALWNIFGNGSNVDLGILYDGPDYAISSFGRNIIPNNYVRFSNQASELLPFQWVTSIKYKMAPFHLFGQYALKESRSLYSGAIRYTPSPDSIFNLSIGIKQFLTANVVNTNATLGMQLNLSGFNVYFAYERSDYFELDHKNYLSVSLNL